jgi:hypothetical protein
LAIDIEKVIFAAIKIIRNGKSIRI